MRISEGLLQELDQEAQTTRRLLARVPQEHLEWRPHQKAMTLGQLAMHVATIPAVEFKPTSENFGSTEPDQTL